MAKPALTFHAHPEEIIPILQRGMWGEKPLSWFWSVSWDPIYTPDSYIFRAGIGRLQFVLFYHKVNAFSIYIYRDSRTFSMHSLRWLKHICVWFPTVLFACVCVFVLMEDLVHTFFPHLQTLQTCDCGAIRPLNLGMYKMDLCVCVCVCILESNRSLKG